MTTRMSKAARRDQLLSVADVIVGTCGTDALTLISLAQKAGVSKPVTYEHFGSREGLLSQLYQRYDERVVLATQAVIAGKPPSLEVAAAAVAGSFMECAVHCGPQYEAVVSALQGYPEFSDIRVRIRDYFVDAYLKVFTPFSACNGPQTHLKVIGIYGAIEEMAGAVNQQVVDRRTATEVISSVIVAVIGGA